MTKEIMRRKASDNEYLHRDFHGALSEGLNYLEEQFGPESVKEYLYKFARNYYAPLTRDIQERGLEAIEEHLQKIYSAEGAMFEIEWNNDQLVFRLESSPAMNHMKENGYRVARLWSETDHTVFRAIVEGTDFDYEPLRYDEPTGRMVVHFTRKASA
jgi:hypothetical protein